MKSKLVVDYYPKLVECLKVWKLISEIKFRKLVIKNKNRAAKRSNDSLQNMHIWRSNQTLTVPT